MTETWSETLLRPAGAVRERGVHHVAGERADHPGVLGERQELARREQASFRMVPADERLDRVDVPRSRARPAVGSG